MAVEPTTVPTDEELKPVVAALREAHPSLGVTRLLAQLKTDHPTLSVSEKRLRKVLAQAHGAGIEGAQEKDNGADLEQGQEKKEGNAEGSKEMIAETGLDKSINTSIAPKVKVKLFKSGRGKGLVAREKMLEGEVIWTEEPWIATTSPQINDFISQRGMCSHCLTLFTGPSRLLVECPNCEDATFCNRLCYGRREDTSSHSDLLCPGTNPAAIPLLSYIQELGWRDLQAAARIVAKWRILRESGDEEALKALEARVWGGMARVNQVEKESERKQWPLIEETRMSEFHRAHTHFLAALNPPMIDKSSNAKTFHKILRKRRKYLGELGEEEEARWFSFDSFCQLLGLAGLNQEDSGGLYALHAHLNHDCDPNVRVRNLPKDYPLPEPPSDLANRPMPVRGTNRLTLIARRKIHPGDELTIPYVNSRLPRSKRREKLREVYGFWCQCARCKKEEGKPEVEEQEEEGLEANGHDHEHGSGHDHAHAHEHQHGPGCSH